MTLAAQERTLLSFQRLPAWLRQEIPSAPTLRRMKGLLRQSGLHTVCESALCPNRGRCWAEGSATFMILGGTCTRACRFCAVTAGRPAAVDPGEPQRVASAVQSLGLSYVVITSVTRDDLPDEGAGHFAGTIAAIRGLMPGTGIEVLIPDFSNKIESLAKIAAARPQVVGHNIETVRRLSPSIRPQAGYDRSLAVLKNVKRLDPHLLTKSGLMAGLGETAQEIVTAMRDLAEAGCDMLTIGQYLAPTKNKRHARVARFIPPEEFDDYRRTALEMGFKYVMSTPLARSSYLAREGYRQCLQERENGK